MYSFSDMVSKKLYGYKTRSFKITAKEFKEIQEKLGVYDEHFYVRKELSHFIIDFKKSGSEWLATIKAK